MKFAALPLEEAVGKTLGHNVTGPDGRRLLRKGRSLTVADVALLRELGRNTVYVAELAANDVAENEAAARIAVACAGAGVRLSGAATGRSNMYADTLGVLHIDVDRLSRLNGCDGVTLATLPTLQAVRPGKMVATLKILPYALPAMTVRQAEAIAAGAPLVAVAPLPPRKAALILSGSLAAKARVVSSFETALRDRLMALGATLTAVEFVPLEDEADERALAEAIDRLYAAGIDLIILAGETAIMDRHDIAPRAVERAGGTVTCFGAPVDPGNLLMLAYLGELPILGAPGCVRSPKSNIVDVVLPRLLIGERLSQADIVGLGHGGLLEDIPERPAPRSRLS